MNRTSLLRRVLRRRMVLAALSLLATSWGRLARSEGPLADATAFVRSADGFNPGCRWRGYVKQDGGRIFLEVTVDERDGSDVSGRLRLNFSDGSDGHLSFRGTIEGDEITWRTTKVSGHVTSPGFYSGTIVDRRLTGTWQVPSWNQHDQFCLNLFSSPPPSVAKTVAVRKRELLRELGKPYALEPLPTLKEPGGFESKSN